MDDPCAKTTEREIDKISSTRSATKQVEETSVFWNADWLTGTTGLDLPVLVETMESGRGMQELGLRIRIDLTQYGFDAARLIMQFKGGA